MIPIGKFGFLVLNLTMQPNTVDVNVHPAKLEVRFQEEQKVFKAIYCAIQDTLLKAELVANSETPINGKLERNVGGNMYTEEEQKSSITGLFRKIAKSSEYDFGSNNVIESIYNSKNGANENEVNTKTNTSYQENEIQTIKQEAKNELPKLDNIENMDLAQKLETIKAQLSLMNEENAKYTHKTNTSQVYASQNLEPKINEDIKIEEKPKVDVQNIQTSVEPKPENNQIKNTINELMQMGKNLTAEQIREKIAKLAQENNKEAKNIEEKTYKEEKNEINQNITNEIEKTTESNSEEKTNKYAQSNWSSLYTRTNPEKPKTNMISEEEEKYSTKLINTEEIQKLADSEKNKEDSLKTSNIEQEDVAEIVTNNIPTEQISEEVLLSIIKEQNKELVPQNKATKFDDMYEQIFGQTTSANKEKGKEEIEKTSANDIVKSNMSLFEENEEYKDEITYKLVGIAFKTYIILEIEDELYILDQHAAHERIMYEKVKKNYYSDEDKDSQLMLLPDIITLTHKEMDIARENMDKFEKAGFVLEEFGENTIKLTGVPNICLDLDTKELFLETLDEINTVARTAKQEIEERFIATIACKAAVKANMALTEEEVESLLEELLKLPNPFTCPHGRPTAIKLSKTDIEKKFARRK